LKYLFIGWHYFANERQECDVCGLLNVVLPQNLYAFGDKNVDKRKH